MYKGIIFLLLPAAGTYLGKKKSSLTEKILFATNIWLLYTKDQHETFDYKMKEKYFNITFNVMSLLTTCLTGASSVAELW